VLGFFQLLRNAGQRVGDLTIELLLRLLELRTVPVPEVLARQPIGLADLTATERVGGVADAALRRAILRGVAGGIVQIALELTQLVAEIGLLVAHVSRELSGLGPAR